VSAATADGGGLPPTSARAGHDKAWTALCLLPATGTTSKHACTGLCQAASMQRLDRVERVIL
jgi:hypothetical protein